MSIAMVGWTCGISPSWSRSGRRSSVYRPNQGCFGVVDLHDLAVFAARWLKPFDPNQPRL